MQIQPPAFQNQYIALRIQALGIQNYSEPQLFCGSNNKMTLICINKYCNLPSLHCQSLSCICCQGHHQRSCHYVFLRYFTESIKKRSQNLKHFVNEMVKIEAQILNELDQRRRKLIQQVRYTKKKRSETYIVQGIFGKSKYWDKLKGSQALQMFQNIKKNNQIFRAEDQVSILRSKMSEIADQIIELQKKAMKEIIQPKKYYAQFNSRILKHNPAGMRYILQQLYHPPELKLLYRASHHGFSAQKFHQRCDYKPFTLTIINTVFNQVIAGFTPLTWDSQSEGFKYDKSQQTFVLSVTHRQKYQKVNKQKQAIYCSPKYGPIFGQSDFHIEDGDPENRTYVKMDFPKSFNFKSPYAKSPLTTYKILGDDVDQIDHILVDDYEVYKIKVPKQFQIQEQSKAPSQDQSQIQEQLHESES